jgi:chromosome segregation ATPase
MCGTLSEEGSDLKLFISKLQTQLSGALSESNSLRGTAKSLEAKVFELMSETQMYRGQIDELQVIVCRLGQALFPRFFARCNTAQSLLLCAKDQQRSLDSESQAKAERSIADLQAQLAATNHLLSEERVKVFDESNARRHLEVQLKDSTQHSAELGLRIKDLDSSNRQLQERLSSASQQACARYICVVLPLSLSVF